MAESVGAIGLDLVLNQNQFKSQMKGITSLAKKAGATLAGAFAVKKVVDFGEQCIELGSDLAEVQNVVDVAFPKMNETINKFAKNAAAQFGLSETMAKRYTGTFGAMSQAFGFTEKEAAEMSTTLTGLSGDVASFYNISQDEAYTKLKSVFTGETESLKDLGVVMTQTALDQYALVNGFGKTTAKMSEQEKVALRYQFVQAQLSKASGDFARTSDSWANQTRILSLQLDGLKATLGQGFINLFSPIIKAINTLLGKLSTLANAFKSFTELITGKKSEDSSIGAMADDTATVSDNAENAANNVSSIGDAAKKAKKKLGSLASWDELNVRTDDSDNDSDSSGSGVSGVSVDYGKAADLGDTAFNKLGKTMDAIKNKFLKMGKLFAQGFSIGFQSKGLDKIKNYLSEIGKNVKDIFLSPEVLSAASKWADNVALNLGKVVGSVSSIGVSIETMLIGGVSKFLDQNKNFIKKKIVEIFDISSQINSIVGNFSVALADIFTVFEGDDAQQIVADILSIFTTVQLELQVLCLKIGRDIIDTITAPIIENKDKIKTALENTIRPISEIIGSIKDSVEQIFSKIQETYDRYVEPAFSKFKNSASKTFATFLNAYNKYIAPVLSYISKGFKELMEKYITPMAKKVTEAVGKVIDAIAEVWNFISPFFNWIISIVLKVIGEKLKVLWDTVKGVFAGISTIISGFANILGGLADFVAGVFSGNWKKAWNGIKNIFSGALNLIKGTAKTAMAGLSAPFRAAWEAIKSTFGGIGGWFKNKFSEAWKGIKSAFNNTGKFFSDVWGGIKDAFGNVTGWFKDKFSKAWQAVKNVFSTGGKVFDGIKEGIAGVFKTVVNGLISGINVIISKPFQAINGMLNKIRNVGIAGVEPFKGLWEENPLPLPQIPKLAQGDVIKPNAPFLAMLGDQKHGTNVEAPLETIKQALRDVQNENGNNTLGNDSNISVNVFLEGEANGVFKLVRAEATKYKNRTGTPAFS